MIVFSPRGGRRRTESMIDGVRTKRLKVIPDERGMLMEMLRDDELYTWVVDIGHNPDHVPSKGSCIFFHVWGGKDSTTVGCTAMAQPDIEALLGRLRTPLTDQAAPRLPPRRRAST